MSWTYIILGVFIFSFILIGIGILNAPLMDDDGNLLDKNGNIINNKGEIIKTIEEVKKDLEKKLNKKS